MEDIHLGGPGKNFGWPKCEGNCNNPNFPECSCAEHDDPIFTYAHKRHNGCGDAAVIGGPVLRNAHWPTKYQGGYFYGDFARGGLRYLEFATEGGKEVKTSHTFSDLPGKKPIHLNTDPRGALWILADDGGRGKTFKYQMIKIDYFTNEPPTIMKATASVLSGYNPLPVSFDGVAVDFDTPSLQYEWHFGDGQTSYLRKVTHVYQNGGKYAAVLYVNDGKTTVASDVIEIVIGVLPELSIVSPLTGSLFRAGDTFELVGTGTYKATAEGPSIPLPKTAFSWSVHFIHGEHTHALAEAEVGPALSFDVPAKGHGHTSDTGFLFSLSATSPSSGLTKTVDVSIYPVIVEIPFTSSPPGIVIMVDGASHVTPFVLHTTPGFDHKLVMPSCHQGLGFRYLLKSVTGPWRVNTDYLHVPLVAEPVDIHVAVDGGPCAYQSQGNAGAQQQQQQQQQQLSQTDGMASSHLSVNTNKKWTTPACIVVPEYETATLKCPPFSIVTGVRFASFGAAQGECGAGFEIKDCHSPSTMASVMKQCLGASECQLSATDQFVNGNVMCTAPRLKTDTGSKYEAVGSGAGYCRGGKNLAKSIFFSQRVPDIEACQAKCSAEEKCTGIQFSKGKRMCQLYSMPLTTIKKDKNAKCYAKHPKTVWLRQPLTLAVEAECTSFTTTTHSTTIATQTLTTVTTPSTSTLTVEARAVPASTAIEITATQLTPSIQTSIAALTISPTIAPTAAPTAAPSAALPTAPAAAAPSAAPTAAPTTVPSAAPTAAPSAAMTATLTAAQSAAPTATPTAAPTTVPTAAPTATPSAAPSSAPSAAPTAAPTAAPLATTVVFTTKCKYDAVGSGGGYCRGSKNLAKSIFYNQKVPDIDACQAKCSADEKCTGIQFSKGKRVCQLYSIPLTHIKKDKNAKCYSKHCSAVPTIRKEPREQASPIFAVESAKASCVTNWNHFRRVVGKTKPKQVDSNKIKKHLLLPPIATVADSEDCAAVCISLNCWGFSHDSKKSKCYLWKSKPSAGMHSQSSWSTGVLHSNC